MSVIKFCDKLIFLGILIFFAKLIDIIQKGNTFSVWKDWVFA